MLRTEEGYDKKEKENQGKIAHFSATVMIWCARYNRLSITISTSNKQCDFHLIIKFNKKKYKDYLNRFLIDIWNKVMQMKIVFFVGNKNCWNNKRNVAQNIHITDIIETTFYNQ